jgi:eukaryotic-like serine/threonine-protein kinase
MPRATPVADLPVAGTFGPYRPVDTLVSGAQDKVFLAVRAGSGARVALRVLGAETGRDGALFEELREHAARVATMSARCPAIAAIHECGRVEGGGLYLALEHPEGPTLAEVLRRHARLHPERAVRVAVRIAEALESAHMLGTAHGSLTPHNVVLVGEDEAVKLTQFGIDWAAHRIGRGGDAPLGTGGSPYLAPEQILTGEATPQSDVYAVGAILYEALAGRAPEAQLPSRRRVSVQPLRKLRPDVSRSLEHVVTRALEPDPTRRYRDMTDLFNDLWSEISPFSTTAPTERDRMRRRRPTRGGSRMVAVSIVLGAVVVIALLSRLLVSEPPAPAIPARAPSARPEVAAPAPPPAISAPAPVSQPPAPPPPVAAAPPPRRIAEPRARAVVGTSRPARRPAPAPRPAPSREETGPPARAAETPAAAATRESGEDSGAIIDWLLKESSSARR